MARRQAARSRSHWQRPSGDRLRAEPSGGSDPKRRERQRCSSCCGSRPMRPRKRGAARGEDPCQDGELQGGARERRRAARGRRAPTELEWCAGHILGREVKGHRRSVRGDEGADHRGLDEPRSVEGGGARDGERCNDGARDGFRETGRGLSSGWRALRSALPLRRNLPS